MPIKITETLVVSLPLDTERRAHIGAHFPTVGIERHQFVDALNPQSEVVKHKYRSGGVKLWPNCFRCNRPSCACPNNIIIPHQVANWLSFMRAFSICTERPNEYFMICEDDVAFHHGARDILEDFCRSFEPKSDKVLVRMCQSGEVPFRDLTSVDYQLTDRVCMSNAAFILSGRMAELLVDKFGKIETTSDIWIHREIAADPSVHAVTIEPLLATDLSFNLDHAQFPSRIHPKGIDEEDKQRVQSHVKRVDDKETYAGLLESWKQ